MCDRRYIDLHVALNERIQNGNMEHAQAKRSDLIGKTLSIAVTVIGSWLSDGEGAVTDQHGTLRVRV